MATKTYPFRKMVKNTIAEYYDDANFKACIKHICLYEEPGDENKYTRKGVKSYYPFGLGESGGLEWNCVKQLLTKGDINHWRVLPLVLNEYYTRYYTYLNLHLIKNVNILRCAFDINMNIGNLKIFKDWVNEIVPGCVVREDGKITIESCNRLNNLSAEQIERVIENLAYRRICYHKQAWEEWQEVIAKAKKYKTPEEAMKKVEGTREPMGNSFIMRSLSMMDGDYIASGSSQTTAKRRMTTWKII